MREDSDLDERHGERARGDGGGSDAATSPAMKAEGAAGAETRVGGLDAEWLDRASQVLRPSMADEGREEASARRGW